MKITRLILRNLSNSESQLITKDILCSNASTSTVAAGPILTNIWQFSEAGEKSKENKIHIGIPDSAVNQNGHGFFCIDKNSFDLDVYFESETDEACLDYINTTGIAWTIRCYKQAIKDMRRAKTKADKEQAKTVAEEAKRLILIWPQADNYRVLLPKQLETLLGITTDARRRFTDQGLIKGAVRHEVYQRQPQAIYVLHEEEIKLLKLGFLISRDKGRQPTKAIAELRDKMRQHSKITVNDLYAMYEYTNDFEETKRLIEALKTLKHSGISKETLEPLITELADKIDENMFDYIVNEFNDLEEIKTAETLKAQKNRDRQLPNKKNVFAKFKCKVCFDENGKSLEFNAYHRMILSSKARGSKNNSLKFNPECPKCGLTNTLFIEVINTADRDLFKQYQ